MNRRPPPIRCPACGQTTAYTLDDGEWELAGEWWSDPAAGVEYADSAACLKRLREQERQ